MDLDITFIFQLTLFIVVLVLLNGILFRPFLTVIEARHRKIHGTHDDIDHLERATAADRDSYESRIKEARRQAQARAEALRNAGREEERRILQEARAEVARQLAATREQVAAAERGAAQTLAGQTEALARQLMDKILGQGATS